MTVDTEENEKLCCDELDNSINSSDHIINEAIDDITIDIIEGEEDQESYRNGLKYNLKIYFIIELIISILVVIFPLFAFLTITIQYLMFHDYKDSWNWSSINKEIRNYARRRVLVLLLISSVGLIIWVLIGALIFRNILGLIIIFTTLLFLLIHIVLICEILYVMPYKYYDMNYTQM
jgi:hypothetical protein